MANATRQQIPALIEKREEFQGSNLSGEFTPNGARADLSGRLSGLNLDEFQNYARTIRYLVRSYGTPIAWTYADGSTYRVTQKFSVTTSKHMGLLRGF